MHAFCRKLGLISALSVVAFMGGCKGFFVNPTLSSLAVGPTATIPTAMTVQMLATATYSDGTTSTSPSGLFWSSSSTSTATVSSSGLVTGVSAGQATITAAAGSITGSATITVTVGNLTSITIKGPNGSQSAVTITAGSAASAFTAQGVTSSGQTLDVTDSVNWVLGNPNNIAGVSLDPMAGTLTTTSGDTGQVTVQANSVNSNNATITSNTITVTIQ